MQLQTWMDKTAAARTTECGLIPHRLPRGPRPHRASVSRAGAPAESRCSILNFWAGNTPTDSGKRPHGGPLLKIRKNKGKIPGPTENHLRIFHVCPGGWGYFPRPPLTEIEDRRACDSDRRVTVNNIQVILVCGRPGDCPGPARRYSEIRNP